MFGEQGQPARVAVSDMTPLLLAIGSTVGREIIRGLLGGIFGGGSTRRR